MTPPRLFDGRRRWLGFSLIGLVLTQATALVVVAAATRWSFQALHAGQGIPLAALAILAMAGIVAALAQLRFRIQAERIGQDYAKSIRLVLFEHASRSAQSDLNLRRLGYQILRVTGDLTALAAWPGLGLPRLVQAGVLLPTAIGVLAILHLPYLWVAAGLIGPSLLVLVLGRKRLLQAQIDLRDQRARMAADMAERMPIAPSLAAFGRRQSELRRLQRRALQVERMALRRRLMGEALKVLPEISAAIAASLILLIGSRDGLAPASIAAALAALALTLRPLRNTMTAVTRWSAFKAAHDRLVARLNRPVPDERKGGRKLPPGAIAVDIIAADGQRVSVNAGQIASLPVDLLHRISPRLSGADRDGPDTLRLNKVEIADISAGSLRRRIGVLTDTPLLLKGSLRRNLVLGLRPRPTDTKIEKRLAAAGLEPELNRLGGLTRSVAEGGADLAPRDRLALCRMRIALQSPGLVLVCSRDPAFWGSAEAVTATVLCAADMDGPRPRDLEPVEAAPPD